MRKLRIIPTALLVTFGLLSAVGAHAGSIDLGPLSSNSPVTGTVSETPGSFTEYLNFSIANSSTVGATVTSLNLSSILNIAGLAAELYSGSIDGSGTALSSLTNGYLSYSLTSGSYYLGVTGDANGSAGGSFAYAIAPVPEPAESTLMAIGFGMVGFVAISKKRRA